MRLIPALVIASLLLLPLSSLAEDAAPPAAQAAPAAPAAKPAAAAATPGPMMMRILDQQKTGAQIDSAERAEQTAERERRKEIESEFLKKGLRESIDVAVRLGLFAGTIVMMLIIAGALGAAVAILRSRLKKPASGP